MHLLIINRVKPCLHFFLRSWVFRLLLLAALQNADVDLENLTAPRMIVFLVAFENGFFWKEYFDHRRKDKEKNGA